MESLDAAIVAEYVAFNVPADQIVADPDLGEQFNERIQARLAKDDWVDLPALNKRLLNLRRRGQDKGGLPRLRHPK